jgi:hypothetical protein
VGLMVDMSDLSVVAARAEPVGHERLQAADGCAAWLQLLRSRWPGEQPARLRGGPWCQP